MSDSHPWFVCIRLDTRDERLVGTHLVALIVLAFICGCSVTHVGVSAKLDQKTLHAEPNVVFMGDSITALWDTAGFGQSFFSQHPTWTDAGVIGDDSGQMADRFQAQVANLHPQVVVILPGQMMFTLLQESAPSESRYIDHFERLGGLGRSLDGGIRATVTRVSSRSQV